jgi:predicted phage terminase large subunit-like protein
MLYCGGACVRAQTDPAHCGACGRACAAGEACVAGVCCYNQKFTNKQSRKTRRLVRRLGLEMGDVDAVDEWTLANGSTYVGRGAGAGISGEPLDVCLIDDPFKNRQEADSTTVQERVYEWYMDDVTPRIQKHGSLIIIHTRFNPGDLIGRIQSSAEAKSWRYVRLPAIAETQEERDAINKHQGLPVGEPDPIGRKPGEALCEDRYSLKELLANRLTQEVGFESLYQQNPIPRGGTFFQREWFGSPVDSFPPSRLVRYWDLAQSREDSACYTAGILLAKYGDGGDSRFYVVDEVRGRWQPAERNEIMLQTAVADSNRPGFERTYFEKPVYDKGGAASREIIAKLAGYPVSPDNVSGSGSKELRAEPVAGAAKAGLIRLLSGPWNGGFLSEISSFPKGQFKDRVDSLSGGFNKLSRSPKLAFAIA